MRGCGRCVNGISHLTDIRNGKLFILVKRGPWRVSSRTVLVGKVIKSHYSTQAQPHSLFGRYIKLLLIYNNSTSKRAKFMNLKINNLMCKKCCAHLITTELFSCNMEIQCDRKSICKMKRVLKFEQSAGCKPGKGF